jgi:hypothetical protein
LRHSSIPVIALGERLAERIHIECRRSGVAGAVSDSHLFAEADGTLLGMNTCDSLQRVIELRATAADRPDAGHG